MTETPNKICPRRHLCREAFRDFRHNALQWILEQCYYTLITPEFVFFPSPWGKLGTPLILNMKLITIKKCYVPILTAPLWTNGITSACAQNISWYKIKNGKQDMQNNHDNSRISPSEDQIHTRQYCLFFFFFSWIKANFSMLLEDSKYSKILFALPTP